LALSFRFARTNAGGVVGNIIGDVEQ